MTNGDSTKKSKSASGAKKRHPQVLDLRPGHNQSLPNTAKSGRRISDIAPASKTRAKTIKSVSSIKPVKAARSSKTVEPELAAKSIKSTAALPANATSNTDRPGKASANVKRQAELQNENKLLVNLHNKADSFSRNVQNLHHKFITSRLDHIRLAKRNVIIWLAVMLVLIVGSFVQLILVQQGGYTMAAVSDGSYAEGTTDKITTISPLYANTNSERAASQLVYEGLLHYDEAGKLHTALASSWSADDTGKVWTVELKPNLKWSDGKSITADDVVMTVQLMQNSKINANLAEAWKDIGVSTTDKRTVQFTLPSPLMSFDSNLTFGILPKHQLNGKSNLQIADSFSKSPSQIVGSGPFMVNQVNNNNGRSVWDFKPNPNYYGEQPKLKNFSIRTYNSDDDMIKGFEHEEINAIAGATVDQINDIKKSGAAHKVIQTSTADGVYTLFNCDGEITGDSRVRDALRLSLDRTRLRDFIGTNDKEVKKPKALEGPIATGVYSEVDKLKQPSYNQGEAEKLLDKAGWKLARGSEYRSKGGKDLSINIVTIEGTNYQKIANQIAKGWKEIGVNAKVVSVKPNEAQQSYLMPRNFDVLIYQIHLGSDPDMYSYWASSQATETGLNFANYTSRRADIALNAGRSNANTDARRDRYVSFVKEWLKDDPAIALYQSSYFYIVSPEVSSISGDETINDAASRFVNVFTWTAKQSPVLRTP